MKGLPGKIRIFFYIKNIIYFKKRIAFLFMKTLKINGSDKINKKILEYKEPKPSYNDFKKKQALESFITGGSPNIAIRLADTGFLREIINICGPIISTSATISGIKTYPKKIKDIPPEIRN